MSSGIGGEDRFNCENKYQADEPGQRLAANARVWCVFLEEAGHFDFDMVEKIRDTVDVILVFVSFYRLCNNRSFLKSSRISGWSLFRHYCNASVASCNSSATKLCPSYFGLAHGAHRRPTRDSIRFDRR